MMVAVRLFAAARDLAGRAIVELELPSGATIGQLRQALVAAVPPLAAMSMHLVFAMNANYAADDTLLEPGAELACIPPVSGG